MGLLRFDPALGDVTPGASNDCSPLNDDCSNPATLVDGDTPYSTTKEAIRGHQPADPLIRG